MRFEYYEQLIEHLKQQPTQSRQLEEIIKYFHDNVEFDNSYCIKLYNCKNFIIIIYFVFSYSQR